MLIITWKTSRLTVDFPQLIQQLDYESHRLTDEINILLANADYIIDSASEMKDP